MPQLWLNKRDSNLSNYARVKRPREIACFSFDDNHDLRLDDSGIKYYYTPKLGVKMSDGFEKWRKLDDTKDDHLEPLLKCLLEKEKADEYRVEADVITWRGMMTKILLACNSSNLFEMNATRFQGTIYIEEDHAFKLRNRLDETAASNSGVAPEAVMTYWGYKFETLSVLPRPWAETSREFIEARENAAVDNHAQYCSVVSTGVGDVTLILGGEVDAIWDEKPSNPSTTAINWVELKTMAKPELPRQAMKLERRLQKWWAQSFLLGVPKIIVGFRENDHQGTLLKTHTFETTKIPEMVTKEGRGSWDHKECIGFMKAFLEFLKRQITEGGVWKISRTSNKVPLISLERISQEGTGDILSKEFLEWRLELETKEHELAVRKDRLLAMLP